MSEEIKEAKKIMLNILVQVDKICKQYNINYWLDSGTLLGSIRHKGFIPWDDDIDIVMPRDDYKKFLAIAKNEVPKNIFMQNYQTDNIDNFYFTKLRDTDSLFIEEHEKNRKVTYHQGIFIDIFPMDLVQEDAIVKHRLVRQVLGTSFINFNCFKDILKYILVKSVNILGRKKLLETSFRYFNNINNNYFVYGTEMRSALSVGNVFSIHKNFIFPLVEVDFEGHKFNAPNNYDKYLESLYGDYMLLPPIEKQRPTHYHKIYIKDPNKQAR